MRARRQMERAAFGHSPEGWHRHMVKKHGEKKATALLIMGKGSRLTGQRKMKIYGEV
jgi:hypothetical protein